MINEILKELLSESKFDTMGVASIGGAPASSETLESPISSETNINEEDEVKLSAKSIRTLFVAHIAEQLVNEEVDTDEDISKYGLMLEGKLTVKGKDWIKKFLPTIYAS